MAVLGLALLHVGLHIKHVDIRTTCQGVGTGLISSALLSLLIEGINKANICSKNRKYRLIILDPILTTARHIYIDALGRMNDYVLTQRLSSGWVKELYANQASLTSFIQDLANTEYAPADAERLINVNKILDIPVVQYRSFLELFTRLPKESLLYDGVITQVEYDQLMADHIVECAKDLIDKHNTYGLHLKEATKTKAHLLGHIVRLTIKIINTFEHCKTGC